MEQFLGAHSWKCIPFFYNLLFYNSALYVIRQLIKIPKNHRLHYLFNSDLCGKSLFREWIRVYGNLNMFKKFNILGIFIYLFRQETFLLQFHFHVYRKKKMQKGVTRVQFPPNIVYLLFIYNRKKLLIQILNFTCQYESSDLSIFQNIALGTQLVTFAYNETSFLSQKMFCIVTTSQSRLQSSTLNLQGHLVIS